MTTTANPVDRPTIKTTKRDLTYFDARVTTTTIHHDKGRAGLRTVYMEWHDDADPRNGSHPAGTITRKVIKGDGRRDDFQVIEDETVVTEVPA